MDDRVRSHACRALRSRIGYYVVGSKVGEEGTEWTITATSA